MSRLLTAGSDVAILGSSGSGKSTLLKCLLGLIQPDTGDIRFDGKPPAACVELVRSSVGAVLQGEVLFTGTIRNNSALFALEPDDATRGRVNEQLRQLCVTIVRVTHRDDEIAGCHAVYRLDGGRLERVAVDIEPPR